jgi:uncharacterized protein YjiS (DUF1127 family)
MPQTRTQTLPFARRRGLVARIVNFVLTTSARRRDRIKLARLDPHLLRDIGLDSGRVTEECAKPFWRE